MAPCMTCSMPIPSCKLSNCRFNWANSVTPAATFPSPVLALDPHRLMSYSKRDMMPRRPSASEAAIKQLQTFFLLDTQTRQPLCLVNASSARHLASATQELLQLAEQILPNTPPRPKPPLDCR